MAKRARSYEIVMLAGSSGHSQGGEGSMRCPRSGLRRRRAQHWLKMLGKIAHKLAYMPETLQQLEFWCQRWNQTTVDSAGGGVRLCVGPSCTNSNADIRSN